MAWVTVRQATELTGKARSSLYRDMAKGRVSYRTEADGGRVVDTSELIRVYGELPQFAYNPPRAYVLYRLPGRVHS